MSPSSGRRWAVVLRYGAVVTIALALTAAALGVYVGRYYMLPINAGTVGIGVAVFILSRRLSAGWTRLEEISHRLDALQAARRGR